MHAQNHDTVALLDWPTHAATCWLARVEPAAVAGCPCLLLTPQCGHTHDSIGLEGPDGGVKVWLVWQVVSKGLLEGRQVCSGQAWHQRSTMAGWADASERAVLAASSSLA